MPVHVEEMTSEVTVLEGELPLSEAQIDKLVKLVLAQLEKKQREQKRVVEATKIRSEAMPPLQWGE